MAQKEIKIKNTMMASLIFLLLVAGIFMIKGYLDGHFSSVESLRRYIAGFGIFAPLALILIQMLQVVLPVLPGFLGCFAGAGMFGAMEGFWCNYIGICLGSFIAYVLARKYGVSLVLAFFSEKQYNKWQRKIAKSRSYDWLFFIATLLPMFPDDLLCYFSGLMKMNMKKYILILIVGKPWCILAYCIIFGFIK